MAGKTYSPKADAVNLSVTFPTSTKTVNIGPRDWPYTTDVLEEQRVLNAHSQVKSEADEGGSRPLSKMNKDQLVAVAGEAGIETEGKTKAQLIEAINGAPEPADEQPNDEEVGE